MFKNLILLLSFSVFNLVLSTKLSAQKNKSETAATVAATAAIIGTAILKQEQLEELFEQAALNYMLENYSSDYPEFKLKVIPGEKGKKWSDNGAGKIIGFELTRLKNGIITNDRQVLLFFGMKGFISDHGINMERGHWEIYSSDDWNELILFFANMNSPCADIPDVNSVPYYEVINPNKINSEDLLSTNSDIVLFKQLHYSYQDYDLAYRKTSTFYNLSDLTLRINGLYLKKKLVFPFYPLGGDEYLVERYSDNKLIFANENTMGFYLQNIMGSILFSRSLIKKIHSFLHLNESTNKF